jgi:hypothetical protein
MSAVRHHQFLRACTTALRGADWTTVGITTATRRLTRKRAKWLTAFAARVLTAFPERPSFTALFAFLETDTDLRRLCHRIDWRTFRWEGMPQRRKRAVRPSAMGAPPASLGPLPIPGLPSTAALAEWLGVRPGKLLWYADLAGRNRKHPPGPLRPYRYRWVPKPGGRRRLLEIPNAGLKRIQRQLLGGILNHIPPHPAAHGFRTGRSVVTNAAPHCGKGIVLRLDLVDFFPSVPAARVVRTFHTLGYPETVARLLVGLCTTRLPGDVWDSRPHPAADGSDHAGWQRLASRHLPQGAPTSPTLANLAAFRLDRRLAKLAAGVGAEYTRYADDLTFSGGEELARRVKRVASLVAVIAGDEGFMVNHRKTRVMRRGGRQHVTGVVVNVRPNVPRAEFDRLKAVLTNCVRHGPAGQNRENRPDFRAYLMGKLAHLGMVNPARGRKLWMLFDRIAWDKLPA